MTDEDEQYQTTVTEIKADTPPNKQVTADKT